MAMVLLAAGGACQNSRTPPIPSSAPIVTPLAPAPPPPQTAITSTASLSIAAFKGDNMTDCSTVTVVTRREESDVGAAWITAEQIAVGIVEDFVLGEDGGHTLLTDEGPEGLSFMLDRKGMLSHMAEHAADRKARAKARGKVAENTTADEVVEMFRAGLVWPPKSLSVEFKKGSLARVDDCAFPGRRVLATCSSSDSVASGSWTWEQRNYSVATTIDSDAALKRCLRVHGKWSAADPTSSDVARERFRQHSRKLLQVTDPDQVIRQMQRMRNAADGHFEVESVPSR